MSTYSIHTHSKHSTNDALPTVEEIVRTVASYGQPAIGLTDHGNMSGSVQLYQHATKAGIKPFPGSELYVVHDRNDKKAKRHHMCVVAYTTQGYKNLVRLSTLTYRNFYHKPLIDHSDLAELSEAGMLEGIAATSGCFFGFIAQAVSTGDELTARQLMTTYAGWFPKFYVELQNHNIDHGNGFTDDDLASELFIHAYSLGIPVILTQDSHYCHPQDKDAHDALKRLVAFGDDPDDAVFPGDGFHLADDDWFRSHHDPERYAMGADGLADLLAAHDLTIPQLDNYHYNIPFTTAEPDDVLRRRCEEALAEKVMTKQAYKEHVKRLEEELSVIKDTGMAGYLLLVQEVTEWCKANKVFFQARGSASGSECCWLLNITQFDPIKWGLSFERFISRDRTKPPDIDLDVESARRKDLIEWASTKYAVVQIGTFSEYSMKGNDDDDEGSKGSVLIKYYSGNRRRGTGAIRWEDVPAEDKASLHSIADHSPFASYGTHAAGLVVTTTESELADLVPMMLVASSATFVTQYEMDDIESMGLVKLDALGVKTLDVLHKCMENLGRDVFDGLGWIPMSDGDTYRRLAKGDTEGVFQLEGYTAQKGCKRLRPTTIKDIIAAMALFRPATMNSGATETYIRRKHKEEPVTPRNPLLDEVTKNTYGILLFQEQVISILRQLGMDANNLTKFLKSVKASNSNIGDAGKVIDGYREMVWAMAVDADFSKRDWEWFWESATGFAAYGFNECTVGSTTVILDPMAISGETEEHRAGANQHSGVTMTVREFYDVFHGPKTPARDKYRSRNTGLRIAAHKDGRVVTDRIIGVVANGVKPVYTMTLANDLFITSTDNHRHLTFEGWKELKDIKIGDLIATMGEYENYSTPTGGDPHLHNGRKDAYAQLPTFCEICGETQGRLEIAHLDNDRQNNTRENIKRLCNSCHKKWDWDNGARKRRWTKGRPIDWSAVESIEYAGEEQTFDLQMEGDDHSWVGNGIVTHNSHSTAYGVTAYRCGYLATHHTVEFYAAVLAVAAGTTKEPQYIKAVRDNGIRIRKADINASEVTYSADKKTIRKGLMAIKGIGEPTARKIADNRPEAGYASIAELCRLSKVSGSGPYLNGGDLSVGVIGKLYEAGALDFLEES